MGIFNLFSQFGKSDEKELEKQTNQSESFAPPQIEDATVVHSGGVNSYGFDFSSQGGASTNENALIDAWRELASRPEISSAVDEVVYDAIVADYKTYPVSIDFSSNIKLSDSIKKKVSEEFLNVLGILNFNRDGSQLFRQWYVDGKIYLHGIVDTTKPANGLIGYRLIDPKSIKKVVEIEEVTDDKGVSVNRIKNQYYAYTGYSSPRSGLLSSQFRNTQTVKVHYDAIASSNSGLFRDKGDGTQFSISHLDKSLKIANQMRLLEDSLVIYRLVRTPQRRAFYIDTGNLPRAKAEEYMHGQMNRFKNKMTYDTITGEVKDSRNVMSMFEDYWLPRREGGRGTEISTIDGGDSIDNMDDVNYFLRKLMKSMNIPSTRLNSESTFSIGRSGEITREEVKFSKFIEFLRMRFSEVFIQLLKIQLITKNVMSVKEFEKYSPGFTFIWKSDAYWDELKKNDVLQTRAAALQQFDQYVGTYISRKWISENILMFSEEERNRMKKEIEEEREDNPEVMGGEEGYGPTNMGSPVNPISDYNDRNNDGQLDKNRLSGLDNEEE